jgi:hypothetical protein
MPLGNWESGRHRLPMPAIPAGLGGVVLVQGADLRILGAATLRPAA